MNIIGLSGYFHDSAACLMRDGELVAAVSEERLSRFKNDARLPVRAFRYCLEAGGLDITDLDCVAYYELPKLKLERQLASRLGPEREPSLSWLDCNKPEREIREVLGAECPIRFYPHHMSHAAASFLFSGFEDAAILTVDGVGEWATCSYANGSGSEITLLDEVRYPHSLGLFYSTITSYLGFEVFEGEYKVMGLAPYGKPRFIDELERLIRVRDDGQIALSLEYFSFVRRDRMYTDALIALLGVPPREPETELLPVHVDLACSLQRRLEEVLLALASQLAARTGSKNLCLGGGVALNCVANGELLRRGTFERLFVQPAAGDAGSALGAAALAHVELTGKRHTHAPLRHVYLGPAYAADDIAYLLAKIEIEAQDFRGREPALLAAVVEQLATGKIVGWFDGRAEFGPRSLGARSILADPRGDEMRERINRVVKKREAFRPFAPSILESRAAEHLQLDHPSPFMLETCRVTSRLALPAITHVDGSCRPQTVSHETNPRFAALLEAFEARTDCPILLNTSFNVRGEPIVCSPIDALRCFAASEIDCLVLGDFVILRAALPELFPLVADFTMPRPWRDIFSKEPTDAVYTFI
jgi:carbamoyltransferase